MYIERRHSLPHFSNPAPAHAMEHSASLTNIKFKPLFPQ